MSVSSISLLYVVVRLAIFSASCALLVMGVLVTVNKEKQTKILGIGFIIAGVFAMISSAFTTFRSMWGVAVYAKLSTAQSYASILISIATTFCLCWYIHQTYGKKYIYVPVYSIMVVNRIASVIVALCLNKTGKGAVMAYWISLVNNINGLVTGTVIAVIFFLAFYQNRDKEKIIPDTWKIRIVLYAFSLLKGAFYISAYLVMLKVLKDHTYNPGGIFGFLIGGKADITLLFIELTGALVDLVFPIYVFVRLKKVEAQKIAEQASGK